MASHLLERSRAFDWSYTSSPKAGVGGEASWTPWSLGASREPLSLGWAKHCEKELGVWEGMRARRLSRM